MGSYQCHLWNMVLLLLRTLPKEHRSRRLPYHQESMAQAKQDRIAACHITDSASKQAATSVALQGPAWLRSASISDGAHKWTEDLPFDGAGLFTAKTDGTVDNLQEMRKTQRTTSF
ncbi:hypothetical protein JRQ81_013236 [Phrynocephalus forsythii]|uniref:Uncharacterized protein n=1 Tax=Phrynocephalus forsythii TaxID=171643 RepID=A0A9Q1B4K3_9SAUR|nr:hypothetical protein JRQ81_013236 [Phrynocephalus forsythii]